MIGDKAAGAGQGGTIPHAVTAEDRPAALSPVVQVLLFVGLLALAALLRFYHLDGSSLWHDEGNTWALMGRSFGEIAAAAAADIHPPLYYWLLKLWSGIFGANAFALRSFSAVLGVLLVFLVQRIGTRAADYSGRSGQWLWLPWLAAFLAAVNPFQIYYSQEARMYMLLAVEAAGLFWALLALLQPGASRRAVAGFALLYVLCGAAGLWTHYSFPIVLAAAVIAYAGVWGWRRYGRRRAVAGMNSLPLSPARFVVLNLIVLALFLPWLPTAIERVLNWPQGGVEVGLGAGVVLTVRTLLFGPIRTLPEPLWPWLLAGALLPLAGIVALRRRPAPALSFSFWLLLPMGLMFALGLFSPAFLKFLLVASPAWCLLAAAAPGLVTRADSTRSAPRSLPAVLAVGLVALFGLGVALAVLPGYYADPAARDNYRGVANFLALAGNPEEDLVVLDAPGQQEVWRYYDPGLPVLALPEQRPPDPAATEAALAAATRGRDTVYALFWATDEADPAGLVEGWLDRNAFPALDAWQGNLRFVTYRLPPDDMPCNAAGVTFGGQMRLVEQCQPDSPQHIAPGAVALVRLVWAGEHPLTARYKATVQLLDERGQVVAQHDSEPGGGALPTDRWTPGEPVVDNHGLFVPPGTPPGRYRLVTAVYDPATGARLPAPGESTAWSLGEIVVESPHGNVPLDLLPVQHRVNARLGPVTLVGYSAHKKDFAHAPETLLAPGDTAHYTFYWQAPDPLPPAWPADLTFTLSQGNQTLTAPLAGGSYPTSAWPGGAVVRGEFDLPYDPNGGAPSLKIGATARILEVLPSAK